MLLTNKEDILKAMEKDIAGASASTINWLAETFNVSLHSEHVSCQCPVDNYSSRIHWIKKELTTKSLAEVERDRNLTHLPNIGMGYVFSLKSRYPKGLKQSKKNTYTSEFERFEKLVVSVRHNEVRI